MQHFSGLINVILLYVFYYDRLKYIAPIYTLFPSLGTYQQNFLDVSRFSLRVLRNADLVFLTVITLIRLA